MSLHCGSTELHRTSLLIAGKVIITFFMASNFVWPPSSGGRPRPGQGRRPLQLSLSERFHRPAHSWPMHLYSGERRIIQQSRKLSATTNDQAVLDTDGASINEWWEAGWAAR